MAFLSLSAERVRDKVMKAALARSVEPALEQALHLHERRVVPEEGRAARRAALHQGLVEHDSDAAEEALFGEGVMFREQACELAQIEYEHGVGEELPQLLERGHPVVPVEGRVPEARVQLCKPGNSRGRGD